MMKEIIFAKAFFNFANLIIIFLLTAFFQKAQASTECPRALTPPHLVIGIDGVSYDTFNKSRASGHFPYLNSVVPMISTFPSISDHNWNRMLGTDLIESYTMEHFSPSISTRRGMGRRVGGLLLKINPPVGYFKAFDDAYPTVRDRLTINAFLETAAKHFVRRIVRDYHRLPHSTTPSYKVLIGNPDMIAHLRGEEAVLRFLEYLDGQLVQLIDQVQDICNMSPPITLLSDHGNAFVDTKYIQYKEHLEDKGWRLVKTLAADNDVAIVLSEILSFGAFYTTKSDYPHIAVELAQDMRDMRGVDIVAVSPQRSSETKIIIYKQDEEAIIYIDPLHSTVFYEPSKGDPLEQSHLFQDGPLDFEDYLFKSYDTDYPYAAVTLWEAFYKNTLEPANVLVSTLPDWAMAGRTLYWLSQLQGRVKSLHGALHKDAATGIFATTEHLPHPAVSVDAVNAFLNEIDSVVVESSSSH